MGLSSAGIGSGLDVATMVSQLMAAEQAPLTAITSKQNTYSAQLSAYGTVKNSLASFQGTLQNLSDAAKLQAVSATPSDASVLSASAGAGAVPGSYAIEVTQLAQAQKLVTAGQASDKTAIGSGVLTFDFGTASASTFSSNGAPSKSVTIGADNTLSGIRDAINAAHIGINASLVNDGDASKPYRLALANTQTGAANSMKISVSDGSGAAGSSSALSALLSHNPGAQELTQTMAAQNATLTVDGIAISKASNSISDVVQGVTLTLKKTNAGSPTALSVARDTATVKNAVQAFVSGYNALTQTLKNLSSYDLTAKKGAVLNGDALVRSIKGQLRAIVTGVVTNGSSGLTRLNQIGVAIQTDGTLALDASKLQSAIDNQFEQLPALFAASGSASDAQLSYSSANSATKAGSYAVSVSQLATQGSWLGQSLGSSPVLISAGVNDTLDVTLDSLQASVTLAPGSYAASALAAAIQARINGSSTFSDAGSAVTASLSAGAISLLSARYGAGSSISLGGNAASTLLGGSGGTLALTSSGVDMVGSLNDAAAGASGQTLIGTVGNDAEGLKIKIAGGAAGSRGIVQYTQGFAFQLDQLASSLLAENGLFNNRSNSINQAVKKLDDNKTRVQARLSTLQKSYTNQFTKLDTTMSKMNSTSSYLTQQLTALAKGASIA